jgi:hypothetical protein
VPMANARPPAPLSRVRRAMAPDRVFFSVCIPGLPFSEAPLEHVRQK